MLKRRLGGPASRVCGEARSVVVSQWRQDSYEPLPKSVTLVG